MSSAHPTSPRPSGEGSVHRVARRAFHLQAQTDVQISPDGSVVVCAIRQLGSKRRQLPISQLHVFNVKNGREEVLHSGISNDVSPVFSSEGRSIAFLSAPLSGSHEVMVTDRAAAITEQISRFGANLVAPNWSPDGSVTVLVEAAEQSSSSLEWFPPVRHGRVWRIGQDRKLEVITPPDVQVWEYSLAPDGRLAAIVSDRPGESEWFTSRLAVMDRGQITDLASGSTRDLREPLSKPIVFRPLAAPRWSPDGKRIACVMGARSDRDIVGGDVCVVDVASGELRNLTLGLPLTATWLEWLGSEELLVAMFLEGEQALAKVGMAASTPEVLWRAPASFDRFWPRFSLSETGTVATTREDQTTPREVWLGELQSGSIRWRPLTALNRTARGWSHPRSNTITWRSPDGLGLSGILLSPRKPDPHRGLVVWVHGGPNFLHQHLFDGWAYPWILATLPELIAESGFSVLLPNPRGSFGWGNSFAESVVGDMGGRDAQDILSGVEAAVTQSELDGSRVGIGGWSYGGFMSAWLGMTTNRFRAAVVGAGTTNWRSQHGTSVLGHWDREYLRDEPYRIGGEYDKRSPINYVGNATTPTLLVHGTADQFVPPGQAIELYTALREVGCASELTLFPGEGHDFSSRRAQMALAEVIVGWFARWLNY
jgi:dipeptidyl aminopeptidase/acylaminoacyl peptidase